MLVKVAFNCYYTAPIRRGSIIKTIKEVEKLENTDEKIAVKFLGAISILTIVTLGICVLAVLNYNTSISVTKEKIEVQAENSNFVN